MANTMVHSPAGTFYFDAVLHVDHHSSVTVTEHPVQTGAVISDHAIIDPQEISLEIGMTDVKGGDGSSVQSFQQFKSIMNQRQPCTVVTRLGTYQDMVLTSISAPDDYTTMNALKATLIFKQIRVVSVATVRVQDAVSGSKPSAQSSQSGGSYGSQYGDTTTQQSESGQKQSVLAQILQKQFSSTIDSQAVKDVVSGTVSGIFSKVTSAVKNAAASIGAKTATMVSTSKATTTASKPVADKVAKLTTASGKAAALLK